MSSLKYSEIFNQLDDLFIDSHDGYLMFVKGDTVKLQNIRTNKVVLIDLINVVGTFVTCKLNGKLMNVTTYQLNSEVFKYIGHN